MQEYNWRHRLNFRLILYFIFGFFLFSGGSAFGQARSTDSAGAARKHVSDSVAAARKYRTSKHYTDSVARAKRHLTEAKTKQRLAHTDSLKDARKHVTDSLVTLRKGKTDSIKLKQKQRSDSIAAIRKYKQSRRYADSVKIVRRQHTDSLKNARQHFSDSVASVRKHSIDSMKRERKHFTDSVKIARKKVLDSVKLVRKHRTDSLEKVKADKLKLAKAKEKKKNDSKNLKLELKMKQKHEAFTNKSMLKKKWTPKRRFFQNSFTHYNYFYNARRKMEEASQNMLRGGRKENYDSLIGLYPFNPSKDSALLSADMDSIIRHVSVGIQIHDPRVKWDNDMYLLLGQAYYYKGRFENAAIAFRYIIANDEETKKEEDKKKGIHPDPKQAPSIAEENDGGFLQHRSVHNEAILWLARTYTQSKNVDFAQAVLSLLASDPNVPEDLNGRIAEQKAFAFIGEDNMVAASTQLGLVVDDDNEPDWLRARAAFLNGQIMMFRGQYPDAAESFDHCVDFFPKIDMDFYARKNSAYCALMAGNNVADALTPLKKVLNDGKYVSYYDQVYYVMGRLAEKVNKEDDAINYLQKSTEVPKASKKQKAQSFAALGDIYYTQGSYNDARRAYDSAQKYAVGNKDTSVLASLQRSKGLAELAGPAGVIHDQDSLRELSMLSPKEQQAAVKRYLRRLEKEQADSILNAQQESANQNQIVTDAGDNTAGDAGNWYFSNPATVQQGVNDFKRKWGNRPLTDNWRRTSAIPPGAYNSATDQLLAGTEETGGGETDNSGLPSEASLLAKIPNTKAQKDLSAKLEQRAYILLAKAYIKQLEDHKQASATLDSLDKKFPDNGEKEEELYLRYQIAMKQNDLGKAQEYSQALLSKFPHSEYATLLKPRRDEAHGAGEGGITEAQFYDQTYNLVQAHQFTEALAHINSAKTRYDDPVFKQRFQITEAMCYAGQGNYNMADSVLIKFRQSHPGDSLNSWANEVSAFVKDMRKNGYPSWMNDTIQTTDPRLTKKGHKKPKKAEEKPKTPAELPPAAYAYVPQDEHYVIFILPGLDSRTAPLKDAIRRVDASKGADSLNMFIDMYNINQAVLIVKKFGNADSAKAYLAMLKAEDPFKDYKEGEVIPMVISYLNYRKLFADKEPDVYKRFYNANYK